MPLRLMFFSALILALCACTSPPYSKPGVIADELNADYQDCASLGALDHFTPETNTSINKSTRACMKARGYTGTGLDW